MSQLPERDTPLSSDASTLTVDQLESHAATLQGRQLEGIRELALLRAYRSDEPREVRLRWARLSLEANARGHGDGPWDRARMLGQDFMLRTWVIEHLGADADPTWNPEILAADTLAALTMDPTQAEAVAAGWRELPIEQISELRRHKNLTAHIERLVVHLSPGPTKDQLIIWIDARKHLP